MVSESPVILIYSLRKWPVRFSDQLMQSHVSVFLIRLIDGQSCHLLTLWEIWQRIMQVDQLFTEYSYHLHIEQLQFGCKEISDVIETELF